MPSDPNYTGDALILDNLRLHGLSCDQGLRAGVNFAYNGRPPRLAVQRSRARLLLRHVRGQEGDVHVRQ
jgi:hypothetical protein